MAIILQGKVNDLDGFSVTRVLPNIQKRMIGPFVFFDHMGPAHFPPGHGINVRPHPHIGLATITYLFEGQIMHQDSLGNALEIHPGDVNWMTAGKGIVHSERETIEVRACTHRLNGIQCWIALPKEKAEIDPSFSHIKKFDLPHYSKDGVQMRLIAGDALSKSSPIKTYSAMFYIDVIASAHSIIDRPNPTQECGVYIIQGTLTIGNTDYAAGQFILLDEELSITATSDARFMMLGGEEWTELPHLHWNFVSFSKSRIEQARKDWEAMRFPLIPSDNEEYTPLPN